MLFVIEVFKEMVSKKMVEGVLMFKNIDGKELNFLTNHRPGARYLYWQYLIALLQICRGKTAKDIGANEIAATMRNLVKNCQD